MHKFASFLAPSIASGPSAREFLQFGSYFFYHGSYLLSDKLEVCFEKIHKTMIWTSTAF